MTGTMTQTVTEIRAHTVDYAVVTIPEAAMDGQAISYYQGRQEADRRTYLIAIYGEDDRWTAYCYRAEGLAAPRVMRDPALIAELAPADFPVGLSIVRICAGTYATPREALAAAHRSIDRRLEIERAGFAVLFG